MTTSVIARIIIVDILLARTHNNDHIHVTDFNTECRLIAVVAHSKYFYVYEN